MKFTINMECTPQEARSFFGLPDIAPLQERMMEELEARMQENIRSLDPETFMKTWMPATIESWGQFQKMFWGQMGMAMPGDGPVEPSEADEPPARSRRR